MKRTRREAYLFRYVVVEHRDDGTESTVLVAERWAEAEAAAKAATEQGRCRVIYNARIPLFRSHRRYVCGSVETLNRVGIQRRGS